MQANNRLGRNTSFTGEILKLLMQRINRSVGY